MQIACSYVEEYEQAYKSQLEINKFCDFPVKKTISQMYGQIIFDKAVKSFPWEKERLFTSGAGKLDIHVKKDKVGLLCYTVTLYLKWIKGLTMVLKL